MEQGMGPEMRKFFQRIINTISYGLLWMISAATAGIYFKLGWREEGTPLIYVIIFYVVALTTLFFLLRYYYKIWKD